MRRFAMTIMAVVTIAAAVFAQNSVYICRNDGNVVTIPDSIIQSMECSKVDSQEVTHTNYVMQIVRTMSNTYSIPLSAIDSISFVSPKYEAVDLGLSVKWATCNVGATKPEGYGGYYAWGETEEKSDYSKSTYKYYNSSTSSYVDIGSSISGTEYDVARAKWGGRWRMPTVAEQQELNDKCTWAEFTYNGVAGEKVTGPNGNSIFLPASGDRYGTDVSGAGANGDYWSGTLVEDGSVSAYDMDFYSNGRHYWNVLWDRYYGLSVRPVE
jgi:hypothetical protein